MYLGSYTVKDHVNVCVHHNCSVSCGHVATTLCWPPQHCSSKRDLALVCSLK